MNPDRSRRSTLLALVVLAPASVRPQAEEKADRFTSYVISTPATLSVKDVVRTRWFKDEQGHFEKGSSGAYERREVISTIEDRIQVGDKTTSHFPFGENPARTPPQEYSVKLIPHESTLFAKFVAKFDPYGKDSGITIEQSGMYEMNVIEGSYEAFRKGGSLTVEIKPNDHERYLAAATRSFQHPGFLTFCGEEYREQQVRGMERQLAESPKSVLPPGVGIEGREAFLQQIRTWRVHAEPAVISTPTRFYFTGDTMRSETAQRGLAIKFVTSIPDASPPAVPHADWKERYTTHKKSDFHAEDFDDTRVLDPREKLPGWYKPKWEQQKPTR